MPKCPKCGARNKSKNKFCGQCGQKLPELTNYCPKCKLSFKKEKFCTQCGKKLVNKAEYYKKENKLKTCPKCKRQSSYVVKKCGWCGYQFK